MDNSKEKCCENCRFYVTHYVKTTHGYAETLGHCVCIELNAKRRKYKYSLTENCGYWQPEQLQKAERKNGLIENLKRLTKQLENVCEVLIDDYNE